MVKNLTSHWIKYKHVLVKNDYGVDVDALNALYSLYLELTVSRLA